MCFLQTEQMNPRVLNSDSDDDDLYSDGSEQDATMSQSDIEEEEDEEANVHSRCSNYKLCQTMVPRVILELRSFPLCLHCDTTFAEELDFEEEEVPTECRDCGRQSKQFAYFRDCLHRACLTCFAAMYFGPGQEEVVVDDFHKCPRCRRAPPEADQEMGEAGGQGLEECMNE